MPVYFSWVSYKHNITRLSVELKKSHLQVYDYDLFLQATLFLCLLMVRIYVFFSPFLLFKAVIKVSFFLFFFPPTTGLKIIYFIFIHSVATHDILACIFNLTKFKLI